MKMTLRQAEILCLLAQGFGNTEIAYKLGLSHPTVNNHITNIMQKTGIDRRTLLAFWALKAGYVSQQAIDNAIDNARGITR